MQLRARDLMQTKVVSVNPRLSLPELEQRFLEDGVSGYPVLEKDRQGTWRGHVTVEMQPR